LPVGVAEPVDGLVWLALRVARCWRRQVRAQVRLVAAVERSFLGEPPEWGQLPARERLALRVSVATEVTVALVAAAEAAVATSVAEVAVVTESVLERMALAEVAGRLSQAPTTRSP
jgi:hypothetical protein